MELREAVVIVTGASSGIGRATALAFARRGSSVVVVARRADLLDEVVGEMESHGACGLAVTCDVGEWDQVRRLAMRVRREFGHCDVVINNAGIHRPGRFARLPIEDIDRVMRTNFGGVVYCTRAFLPMMLQARRGHIVNVSSAAGRIALPGDPVYTSTKHAVTGFSEALDLECRGRGVRVTSVNPGRVATEGFGHELVIREVGRRIMRPERVADAITRIVRVGKAPEVSIPRTAAAAQVARVLAPSLYRFGVRRFIRRRLRARAGAGRARALPSAPAEAEETTSHGRLRFPVTRA